jgi:hypothetical protein
MAARRPILVTGVPRSGTTWLARQLANAAGSAMTGREPMNPHAKQYGLGGTLDAWARIAQPTGKQRKVMRAAYRGRTPFVYSRYGHRQWAAPWPWTRIVVKDPFAMLSITGLYDATSMLPVLVYRHPGAVLTSYRRMGWSPDLREVEAAVSPDQRADPHEHDIQADPVAALAWFWATVNQIALQDLDRVPGAVVVSHAELASGGAPAMRRLYLACGLGWDDRTESAVRSAGSGEGRAPKARVNAKGKTLHELSRSSSEIADAWRAKVTSEEFTTLDEIAGATLASLDSARVDLV